jgi:Fe-S-cluster containining protein
MDRDVSGTVAEVAEETAAKINAFDCLNFPTLGAYCVACCHYGVDLRPGEREALIATGLAGSGDFVEAEAESDGTGAFRTAATDRGCVFLDGRGCRLHGTAHKPEICRMVPRGEKEARKMFEDGYFPCYPRRAGMFN